MKNKIQKLSTALVLLASMQGFSQVGIGTQNPSSKSILDLTATDKGFLLPRMTTVQRNAIAPNNTTDRGLQVFDTNTLSIWFWNGTAWVQNGAKNIYDSNGDIAPTTATNRTVSFTNGGSLNFDSNTMVIDATNNRIGIGTSSPQNFIDIARLNGGITLRAGNSGEDFTNNQMEFGYQGTTNYSHIIKTRHNDAGLFNNAFDFYVYKWPDLATTKGGKHVMSIEGRGVGIGTTSPTQQLHLGNSGNVTANKAYNGTTDDGFSFNHYINTSGENGNTFTRVGDIVVASSTSSTAGAGVLRFLTSTNAEQGGTISEKMRIHSNGNVGIGTATPTNKLHVAGNALFTPRTNNDGTGEPVWVEIYGKVPTGTATQVGGIKMGWYGTYGGIEVLRGASATGVGLGFNVASDPGGVTYEAMRITTNGNVGIGTTSPTSSLTVNGSLAVKYTAIAATSYTINNSDYFLLYNGTANTTFTLPVGTSSACNCAGRSYEIINSSNFNITLTANGTELIKNAATMTIFKGKSVKIVNIGSASGNTWAVVNYGSQENLGSIPSQILSVNAGGSQNIGSMPVTGGSVVIQFPVENFDPYNAWNGTEYTIPESGTYQFTFQCGNTHTAGGGSWFLGTSIEVFRSGTWGGLMTDTRSGLQPGDASNSNAITVSTNVTAGEKIRILAISNSTTANIVGLGSFVITKL